MVNFILVKMCFLHFFVFIYYLKCIISIVKVFFNDFCLGLSDAYFFVEWSENPNESKSMKFVSVTTAFKAIALGIFHHITFTLTLLNLFRKCFRPNTLTALQCPTNAVQFFKLI